MGKRIFYRCSLDRRNAARVSRKGLLGHAPDALPIGMTQGSLAAPQTEATANSGRQDDVDHLLAEGYYIPPPGGVIDLARSPAAKAVWRVREGVFANDGGLEQPEPRQ